MKTVEISTHLNAPVDQVWSEVNKPQLLMFVAHPVLHFIPIEPERLPDRWADGDYIFKLRWHNIVPLGKLVISISRPATEGKLRLLRDNGHGALVRRWDHLISLEPDGNGTRYTDRVALDAGIATPVVAAFARSFYTHRQRRWHRLVESNFNYILA